MKLPRLIIADEIKEGTIPPALLLAYAMQRAGIKLKLFTCSREESDLRLLKLLFDTPITTLDIYTCGSVHTMQTLFQAAASTEALNLVLVPLGDRPEEKFIQVRTEVCDLAQILNCGVVTIFQTTTSSNFTSALVANTLTEFARNGENCVQGVVFSGVRNEGEYQLLKQDFGRKTPILSLGFIPFESVHPMPAMSMLLQQSAAAQAMPLKSAGIQLAAGQQIEWQILDAIGCLHQEWELEAANENKYTPLHKKALIVGEKLLSLEGDNTALLLRRLGCETIDYLPWESRFPLDADLIYFPHSMGFTYAERLLGNKPFISGLQRHYDEGKLIFANGASAPLFGEYFTAPAGQKHAGLSLFPFHGSYSHLETNSGMRKVDIRAVAATPFSKHEEKLKGYALNYLQTANPGRQTKPIWAYRNVLKYSELGFSGWYQKSCLVTDLYINLWSCQPLLQRWLGESKA